MLLASPRQRMYAYFSSRRVGLTIFKDQDHVLKILAGRLVNNILVYNPHFDLDALWPENQPSAVLDDFPQPGLDSPSWNNAFRMFLIETNSWDVADQM